MKILALEFSSRQRSVALVQTANSPAAFLEHEAIETGARSAGPFEMIEEVLRQSATEREQVERLAIGLGPGSYTGIRGSIAIAQGWQLGTGIPLLGVNSAECIAAQSHAEGLTGLIAVVIDAQRGEFYLANYELSSTGWTELAPLRLESRTSVAEHEQRGELLVGPDVRHWFSKGQTVFPRAATLGRLALHHTEVIPGEQLRPIYLRTPSFVKAPPPRMAPE